MTKRPETITHDGRAWIEIGAAARLSRTKVTAIEVMIDGGAIPAWDEGGKRHIPLSDAQRLKRETATMRAVERQRRADFAPRPPGRTGPHAARERQDVLPMSSGRSGTGWSGQKPRT